MGVMNEILAVDDVYMYTNTNTNTNTNINIPIKTFSLRSYEFKMWGKQ